MSLAPLLRVKLSAGYKKHTIIENVSFEIRPGEALGLIGTSGAGKSTLVMAVLGLLPWRGGYADGEVLFEGANLLTMREQEARRLRGKRFALIPQSPLAALNNMLSLRSHFEAAWKAHEPNQAAAWRPRTEDLLQQMQLPSGPQFLARKPGEISVGQAQRVLIALALLHRPSLLIADEPTSALDPVTQAEIVRMLGSLNRDHGTALLYISHDMTTVLQLCHRVAVLDHGRIVECLPVETIERHARQSATMALLDALPAPPEVLRVHSARTRAIDVAAQ